MRKVILFTSSIAATLVLGVVAVEAQRGRAGGGQDRPAIEQGQRGPRGPAFMRGGRAGFGPAGVVRGLDLSDEQQAAIQDLRVAARDQSAGVADELRTTKNALHRAVYADARDAGEVAELAAKVTALEQQLAAARLASEQAIADVLTAEQRELVRTRPQRGPRGGRR